MSPEDYLKKAAEREPGKELRTTIRDFIGKWGAKRRGDVIVDRIDRDLEKYGLTTRPSFKDGWIDTKIKIVRLENFATPPQVMVKGISPETSPEVSATNEPANVTLCFGSLDSANLGVVGVAPDETLEKAQH